MVAIATAALVTAVGGTQRSTAPAVQLWVDDRGAPFGNFSSVQAALDSLAPGNRSVGPVTLFLSGTFRERVTVYSNFTAGVAFVGDPGRPPPPGAPPGAPGALIIYNVSGASGPGTFGSWTLRVDADDFSAAGLAVANDADGYDAKLAGQSVALHVTGDRVALWGVALWGGQDTWYTGDGRIAATGVFVNGTCDAIFGGGSVVLVDATIRMNYTVTAQRGNGSTAYLFLGGSVDSLAGTADLLLGRPWGPQAAVVFVNTTLGAGVAPLGWDDWGHGCSQHHSTWCNETFYAEYNSTGPGADPRGRPWWTHQLTAAEAAEWVPGRLLGDWTPPPRPAWVAP
jgi:pectin methylesterase-like acyl-CoA thioesterase